MLLTACTPEVVNNYSFDPGNGTADTTQGEDTGAQNEDGESTDGHWSALKATSSIRPAMVVRLSVLQGMYRTRQKMAANKALKAPLPVYAQLDIFPRMEASAPKSFPLHCMALSLRKARVPASTAQPSASIPLQRGRPNSDGYFEVEVATHGDITGKYGDSYFGRSTS